MAGSSSSKPAPSSSTSAIYSSNLAAPSSAINISQLSPLQYVNDTAKYWRVDPLPPDLTVINGTLNSTNVAVSYRDSDGADGPPIVERVQPSVIGSVSVVSFIYMIMSVLVIIFMASHFHKWIWVALGRSTYRYTSHLSEPMADVITTREFDRRMRMYYRDYYRPATAAVPIPSYAEMKSVNPSGDFSSQALRDFRELMRAKYRLDCQIWYYKDAPAANQHIMDDMRRRSRGATEDMVRTVERWWASRDRWRDDEWPLVTQIYTRIKELEAAEQTRFQPENE